MCTAATHIRFGCTKWRANTKKGDGNWGRGKYREQQTWKARVAADLLYSVLQFCGALITGNILAVTGCMLQIYGALFLGNSRAASSLTGGVYKGEKEGCMAACFLRSLLSPHFLTLMALPPLPRPDSGSGARHGLPRFLPPPSVLVVFLLLFVHAQPSSCSVLLGLRRRHPYGWHRRRPDLGVNQTMCDLFAGSWVRDDAYPLYQSAGCPVIDPQFNCQLYGRPDSDYQRYKWKPTGCDLPRFDGVEFLTRMRGKTVMFVGDSLGRNQWESLICILSAAAPQSRTQMTRGDPLSTFKFLEYGVAVAFYRAPYLVDIDVVQGKRILRLDGISGNGNAWKGADVLSFNTGHWWSHKGNLQGWEYMGDRGSYYLDMDRLVALQRGLSTWANWVDANVDTTKTRVFFQSVSPTHYNPAEWNDPVSKNCYGETAPVSGWAYGGPYPDQMAVVAGVLRAMRSPPYLLNITTLSELRKDGHPSIYSGDLNPEQRANPGRSADCSHWCLPGLPDTWNHLFYTALLF